MPLLDHLRELRRRLVVCCFALVPGVVLGWLFYDELAHFLAAPVCDIDMSNNLGSGSCGPLVINGLLGPFNLQVKVALATGVALSSPIWLYQIWAFITPALHRQERRWTIGFLAAGIPLFFAGAAVCYIILPRATDLLLGFTPDEATSIVDFNEFLSIVMRLMLVFGLAFEVPVFVVMLNLLGVLPAQRLAGWWRQITFGVFVFAAVATPTGDPLTMTALAVPLCILIISSYLFCRFNDARRARREVDYSNLSDDEASPLDDEASPLDDEASPLEDETREADDRPGLPHDDTT